ncbi:hypothetical protein CC77DRAFT_1061217 [Alternaria alternata]|uniref:Uncharacterized protein n=1 Tax=Alternaria alternata TaxID=5599 RepID=A0A177DMP9_ALTAL|nr:hypothetical protein CC77DRAFT_1061217 [Alternaria alternata]OAG20638.1 hypothetical protein CC77DRAFT_1061217 [Alternaria alternata]
MAQACGSNIHEPRYNPYGYLPPQAQYGAPPPQAQYGAPPPQAQYGAPPPQAQYGAPPSQAQYGAPPSQAQYGAPPLQGPYGGPPPPQQVQAGPAEVAGYKQLLEACIQEKGLQNFPICQNLDRIAQDAPSKINQVIQRWRIQKEISNDIVKLALYDVVLYIDDSGSMQFEEEGSRIKDLRLILERVSFAATLFDNDPGVVVMATDEELAAHYNAQLMAMLDTTYSTGPKHTSQEDCHAVFRVKKDADGAGATPCAWFDASSKRDTGGDAFDHRIPNTLLDKLQRLKLMYPMPGMDPLSIINNTGSECFANLHPDGYLSDKYAKLRVQLEAELRTWRGYLDDIWTLFDGPLDLIRVVFEKAQCLPAYRSFIRKGLRGACSLGPKVLALLMTANLISSAQAQRHDLVREWGIRTTGAVTGGLSIPIAAMDPKTVSPGLWWGLIAAWVVTTVMFVATNTYVIPRSHRMRYLCTFLLVEGLFVVVFVTALIHDPVKMAAKILANMPVLTVIIAGLLPLAFD